MKELSIEEKAKAYDEALSVAQETYATQPMYRDWLAKMFPELKESEDERIRKALIRFHKSTIDIDGIKGDDIITWLEKQDNNPTPINIDKMVMEYSQTKDGDFGMPVNCMIRAYRQGIIDVLNLSSSIEKQGEQNPANSTKTCEDEQKTVEWHREDEQNLNTCLSYIPDEYLRRWLVDVVHVKYDKPADKVEPKFHEKDWIVNKDGRIFQIMRIDNDFNHITYACRFIEQDTKDWVSYSEDDISLWDISNAKNGDVLASNSSTFLFSQEYIGGKPEAHCGIMNGFFIAKPEGCWTNEKIYPANKEQRYFLFAKMHEAGYEWDAERLELKKIEQKPADKAKRYDDLLVKLQEAKVNNDVCDERYCCVIDDIVPELKEKDVIPLLEKQGNQKPADIENFENCMKGE